MNVFILRHGLAVEPGSAGFSKDSERPLTPKGERKVWKIAEALEAMEITFDWILSSPYRRARQTAEIVAEGLDLGKKLEFSEALTPAGSVTKLISQIHHREPLPDNVLLVGHEPYLSELISRLISGGTDIQVNLKKGALCKLSTESLQGERCGTLEWLLTAKQMCLMA